MGVHPRSGQRWTNCLIVGVTAEGRLLDPNYRCGEPVEEAIPIDRLRKWRSGVTEVVTNSVALSLAVHRASEDLGALRIFDPDYPDRVVVAAGAPWFMTLFGRDSLLASWMALPLDQELARGVLQELADAQGSKTDPRPRSSPVESFTRFGSTTQAPGSSVDPIPTTEPSTPPCCS